MQFVAGLAGYRYRADFGGVLKLTMTAALSNKVPTIGTK